MAQAYTICNCGHVALPLQHWFWFVVFVLLCMFIVFCFIYRVAVNYGVVTGLRRDHYAGCCGGWRQGVHASLFFATVMLSSFTGRP